MEFKKSVLLSLAVLSAPAWTQTCQPSAVTPYLNINGKLAKFWLQIATTFKDYDEHLLFAGTNEVGM